MRVAEVSRAVLVAAAALFAAGCSGSGPTAPPLAQPAAPAAPQPGADRAEHVAEALLMADRAERAKDQDALARAAQRLVRLGAAAQTEADGKVLERWFASLPSDAAPMRGRALGPAFRSGRLGPGAATQLNQTFLGGRSARIVLRVANGPAPRLVVQDQSGRQVCAAADDPVTCRWVPMYTQRHRIEIVNAGPAMSQFYIVFD